MNDIKWQENKMPKTADKNLSIMSIEEVKKAKAFHESFPQYSNTPLAELKEMSKYLGLGAIKVKDESYRFGLNAFKVLGGSYSMAKYIAQKFLVNPKLINKVRNMYGYTGYWKDKLITVMSSGMGMPSMMIYASELFKFYDVKKIIRIGTCGAGNKDEHLLDVVVGNKFYTSSNFSLSLTGELISTLAPSENLLNNILSSASENNKKVVLGTIVTMDVFGPYATEKAKKILIPDGLNVVGEEMEGFGLMAVAKLYNKEACCIATISDSEYISEVVSNEDRETSLDDMIKIALDAIIK